MTTINAMKFSDAEGCMICDEQRGWNPDNLKILTADKIKPVIPDAVRDRYGLVACYGNTGTSSWGDEVKFSIKRAIGDRYDCEMKKRGGEPPKDFLTIDQIAEMAYDIICTMKHDHIDQTLLSRYGFTGKDFIRGYYEKNGKKYDIKNADVTGEVDGALVWKGRAGEMTPIFLNAGIVAGWDPKDGFRVFALSLIELKYEPVQEVFLCDGSGRDMATVRMTEYLNMKSVPERRGQIDPVEGLVTAIDAVNAAVRHDIGCYGYFNIMMFNGNAPAHQDKLRTRNGDESKLAMEIVSARYHGLVDRDLTHRLVEDLLLKDAKPEVAEDYLFSKTRDVKRLRRFLRGYKIN